MKILLKKFLTLPKAPKKSFPKNGNPGRLAKTIIRNPGLTGMMFPLLTRLSPAGTIFRPSDKVISPRSTKVYKKRKISIKKFTRGASCGGFMYLLLDGVDINGMNLPLKYMLHE